MLGNKHRTMTVLVEGNTIVVRGIDYALSFYHSYLLPLFKLDYKDGKLVFTKTTGVCKGIICDYNKEKLELICRIPKECDLGDIFSLLGMKSYERAWHNPRIVNRIVGYITPDCIRRISIPSSPDDKKFIIASIILSMNTDYYINTLRWMKEFIRYKSISSGSYQVKLFNRLIAHLDKILDKANDPVEEAVELLSLDGIGVKTAHAYLLHTYGLTDYAPVDRYFMRFLNIIGVSGRVPDKKQCISSELDCRSCPFSTSCIYALAKRRLGSLTGVIQSLIYCLLRTRSKRKIGAVETVLIRFSRILEQPSSCLRNEL